MNHFCSNIFRNENDRQKICVQWFEDALDYCSAPGLLDQLAYWLYNTFPRFAHFILDVDRLKKTFDTKRLSQHHCNTLFLETFNDYVELVPKYNDLLTQDNWLKVGACLILAVVVLVWIAFKIRNSFISSWDLQEAVANKSLECKKCKSNHLRIQAIDNLPNVIFKVPKNQKEWGNFIGFMKENLLSQDSEIKNTLFNAGRQTIKK
jgi:hypothetical protein